MFVYHVHLVFALHLCNRVNLVSQRHLSVVTSHSSRQKYGEHNVTYSQKTHVLILWHWVLCYYKYYEHTCHCAIFNRKKTILFMLYSIYVPVLTFAHLLQLFFLLGSISATCSMSYIYVIIKFVFIYLCIMYYACKISLPQGFLSCPNHFSK